MKINKRKLFVCFYSVLLAITMMQCSETKKMVSEKKNGTRTEVGELDEINTLVISSYKLYIYEENGWSGKFKGYIKAIRGKGVMLSIRSGMNIEVARVWIMNDTLTILNRVDRVVNIVDMKRYLGECRVMLDNDWPMLLMMGKIPVKESVIEETENKTISKSDGGCEIEKEEGTEKQMNRRIVLRILHNEISFTYKNKSAGEGIVLPEKIELDIKTGEKMMRCIIELEEYIINRETEMNIKIPAGYRKLRSNGI
ncbi:MAG TPA: DUF4292 domain-containing protein [Bacteroidetes bacterium]|nr:DUF4292 domain-containing protein [Bacteroidota bacterium]